MLTSHAIQTRIREDAVGEGVNSQLRDSKSTARLADDGLDPANLKFRQFS